MVNKAINIVFKVFIIVAFVGIILSEFTMGCYIDNTIYAMIAATIAFIVMIIYFILIIISNLR